MTYSVYTCPPREALFIAENQSVKIKTNFIVAQTDKKTAQSGIVYPANKTVFGVTRAPKNLLDIWSDSFQYSVKNTEKHEKCDIFAIHLHASECDHEPLFYVGVFCSRFLFV